MASWSALAVNKNHKFGCTFESKWSKERLQKLIAAQLVEKFPTFCRTLRFIIVFARGRYRTSVLKQLNAFRTLTPVSFKTDLSVPSHLYLLAQIGPLPSVC
jgi:hypothetical protein